jgi:hypothetical protein
MDMPPKVALRRSAIIGTDDLFQTVNQASREVCQQELGP